ncbi:GreA/GreB family elongation factor [Limnobacter humi]|uniref:GreA/GreB family elongation factor n=1 Tax=Limnobacter humi TaxID=1778671 RepID=A0ABT1WDL1_9BURK|nr:GreA/GreB family elongation factor [Limnobacter humi]
MINHTHNKFLSTERVLTELDHARLRKLPTLNPHIRLSDLLDNADTVPSRQVAANVITMYTQFCLLDLKTGQRMVMALCYPKDAEPAAGFVSVLSPLGMALIGLKEGDEAHWLSPSRDVLKAVIEKILFQPEASGDYFT